MTRTLTAMQTMVQLAAIDAMSQKLTEYLQDALKEAKIKIDKSKTIGEEITLSNAFNSLELVYKSRITSNTIFTKDFAVRLVATNKLEQIELLIIRQVKDEAILAEHKRPIYFKKRYLANEPHEIVEAFAKFISDWEMR